ncbi:site-specific recombinase XerD [Mucilaginibacter sp. SG538B]|uniref:site-specific integrase n=1 Tax=Mucilaginibacter sp. SG538B TaxID=2587021 RepID=UPI00159DF67F|nr:site-specific integrase [Mucilaginibacter sp. SG538B]NVM66773.1 site-specific recombinase XerD [Mucilaginibacter sp. SG538B]
MLEKSFGLLFFMRRPKNYQTGPLPIYLKITVDGYSKELSTKRKCDPSFWSSESGRAMGKKESVKELNSYLDALEQTVFQAKKKLIESEKQITVEAIKAIMTGTDEKKVTLLSVFRKHNEQMKTLMGSEFSHNTIARYETTLTHTAAFIVWKFGQEDIDVKKLDYEFITEFCFWFKSIQKCNHNSTMKYLSNVKKIVLICVKSRWLATDPFTDFKFTQKKVERVALTEQELQKLAKKKFTSDRLTTVRDIFLFSCYTGLSYADVEKLKLSEIVEGINKSQWIFTNRQKTSTSTRVPMLPEATLIIEKYRNHEKCLNNDRALPILSNQKMNAYLKEIASIAGINKELTFHIARHTFATTITLNYGVPIETVSKMLGHTNIKQTQQYAKLTDKKVSDDMEELLRKRGSLI